MLLSNNFLVLIVLLTFSSSFGRPNLKNKINRIPKCGYESCPKPIPGMINVHIVPHTHDDVGWLKTVDQYYYGSQTNIQKAGVQYIIDSVIQELLKDPKKKFIYVESAFFFKWWKEQTPQLQDQVKSLVNQGRLEFIGGAWSMNDEATTHYQSVIDQFAWGLRLLNDTFGKCGRPRIGWQIDPFGHSREMASMFAQMGYDGLFFGRLDEEDKMRRLTTKTAEMIWKASPNLGESSDLFTGALYNQYQPPPGFCFDILCADEPIIDGHSPDNNIDRRVNEYFDFINEQSKHFKTNNVILTMGGDFTYTNAYVYYNNLDKLIREFFNYIEVMADAYRSNNVLITMGEDFHYQAAHMWYKNLDKLIKYGNEKQHTNNSNINLFYSTPSCYLKALHDTKIGWPTKTDDFFPYGSDKHTYWTGYFTSRPTLKRYERIGNHFLQVCKQLTALSAKHNQHEFKSHLNFMRETMGIMQHHDAVTGTEKQKVADDYAKRIDVGIRACSANIRAILNKKVDDDSLITNKENNVTNHDDNNENESKRNYKFSFNNCLLLNISQCDISEESENFIVTVYNPLARSTFQYIRLPVPTHYYQVKDYRGVPTPSQIVPIPESVQSLNFRKSSAQFELVFLAAELPPMGYKSFYVTQTIKHIASTPPKAIPVTEDIIIGNKNIQLNFKNGLLSLVTANGINSTIQQEFAYYEGANGDNWEPQNRSSGAYIFRPNGTEAYLINERPETVVVLGDLVEEVHQKFNDWISQVVRIYKNENHAEFEWLIGAIPIDDDIGKEIITRFNSDIKSNKIFYTDSNGREMIKRKRDHRDTWNINLLEKISGNYYPLTTKIALEDNEKRMAILVDRAQGGSSITDGSLEIMIHRRLLRDDAFGVGEPLNETAYGSGLVARGHHYLIIGPTKSDSPTTQAMERFVQVEKLLPAWIFLSSTNYTYDQWLTQFTHISSGLTLALPKHLHLMTFEPWHDNQILIRFEHLLENGEDPAFSKSVTFNLKDIFYYLKIESIRETTLDGNQWLNETERLKFNTETKPQKYEELSILDEISVVLKQRQQRTLKDTVQYENYLPKEDEDIFKIKINPMQIRTFIITLEPEV